MVRKITGTCVPVEFMTLGMIDNNVYIIDDGAGCFVVDPSCEPDCILEALGGRKVDAIVLTHGHWDHTGAAADLREATGAPVIASSTEAPSINGEVAPPPRSVHAAVCPVDRTVEDGDVLTIGNMDWQVMLTPGHTPGSICLFLEPTEAQPGLPILVSGDTLFAGAHGRVDFEGGSITDMQASLKRLAALPGDTVVLPGHNSPTTIAREGGWLKLCCL